MGFSPAEYIRTVAFLIVVRGKTEAFVRTRGHERIQISLLTLT